MITLQVAGRLLGWNATKSSYKAVLEAASKAGFPQYTPSRPTDKAALKAALSAVYSKQDGDFLVKPIKEGDGYEISQITEGTETRNNHTFVSAVGVRDGQIMLLDGYTSLCDVQDAFSIAKDTISSSAIGTMITNIVLEHTPVTSLRKNGGLYWMDADAYERFSANVIPHMRFIATFFTGAMDASPEAIKWVAEECSKHLKTEGEAIMAELTDGTHSKAFYLSRSRKAANLAADAKRLEDSLGLSMAEAKKALDIVEQTAATAAIASF